MSPQTPVTKKIWVSGRVQGVGFRYHTRQQAEGLALRGYAKNLADGRVEVLVTGEETKVQRLCSWLHQGPQGSRVDEVAITASSDTAGQGFLTL